MQPNVQKAGKVAHLVLILIVEFVLSSKLFSNSSTLFQLLLPNHGDREGTKVKDKRAKAPGI